MGKTFLTLEIIKHWVDQFNSTPLTQVIFLSKTKCSVKFREELLNITRSLNIPLRVFDVHGVLDSEYQNAFKRFYEAENGETSDRERRSTETNGEMNDSEDESHTDRKRATDNNDYDECTNWISSVIADRKRNRNKNRTRLRGEDDNVDYLKGLRKRGPKTNTLSPRSKLGGHRRTRDFLRLNDRQVRNQKSLLLRKDEPVGTDHAGGAVFTRSRTAALRNESQDGEKNPSSSRFFDEKGKLSKTQEQKEIRKNIDKGESSKEHDEMDHHESQIPDEGMKNDKEKDQKSSDEEQEEKFDLKRGALIIVDDAFVTATDEEQDQNANARSETLYRTIKHLNLLCEASSHHFGVSLVIVSQSPQIVTGSSILANYVRRLKQNIDVFLLFKMDSSTARHFINTISTGQTYQEIKGMLSFATNPPSNHTIDPFDQRGCWPYFAFTLSNKSCNPNLQYR